MALEIDDRIGAVYVFDDGMCQAFGKYAEYLPEYVGPWEQVLPVLKAKYKGTIFWNQSREQFKLFLKDRDLPKEKRGKPT
jgi:hypothetical protein